MHYLPNSSVRKGSTNAIDFSNKNSASTEISDLPNFWSCFFLLHLSDIFHSLLHGSFALLLFYLYILQLSFCSNRRRSKRETIRQNLLQTNIWFYFSCMLWTQLSFAVVAIVLWHFSCNSKNL